MEETERQLHVNAYVLCTSRRVVRAPIGLPTLGSSPASSPALGEKNASASTRCRCTLWGREEREGREERGEKRDEDEKR